MPDFEAAGYETRDLNARGVMWCGIGLAAALVLIFVALRGFEAVLSGPKKAGATRVLAPQVQVPPPQLQTNPAADLATLRAQEDGKLHSYGWVDRNAGIIRIPIERAIELTADRGLPARQNPKGGGE